MEDLGGRRSDGDRRLYFGRQSQSRPSLEGRYRDQGIAFTGEPATLQERSQGAVLEPERSACVASSIPETFCREFGKSVRWWLIVAGYDRAFAMTQFESSGSPLDAAEIGEMMRTARSLRHFVKKVEKNDFFDVRSDVLLFEGTFIAVPVLLAFAMELALKALLYRGGHTKLEKTHDLGCLYKKLSKELRDRIEEKTPLPYPRELVETLRLDVSPHSNAGQQAFGISQRRICRVEIFVRKAKQRNTQRQVFSSR